jgi:hypothetical protein
VSDLISVLKDVTSRLDRAGVRYMISGSMALNYYAMPRMTRDIDLVVEMTIQDLERVSREFSGVYYMAEESMRTAVAERGVFNLIHLEALIKIDFVVRKEGEFRTTEFSRRREAEIGGAKMFIVAPEDLLLSKLAWSRGGESEVQMNDARNLVASLDSIDWGYVSVWAEKLGLKDLIQEVRR